MASTSPVNGLPTVELNTNASGSGGRVLIKDGSTIVYEFTNSRQLKTPGGPMELTGALNVDNTFLVFSDGVHTQEMRYSSDEIELYSGYAYRVRPDLLRLDTSGQDGDGDMVELYRGGVLKASIAQESGDAVLSSEGVGTALVLRGESLILDGTSPGGGTGAVLFRDAGAALASMAAETGRAVLNGGSRNLVLATNNTGANETILTVRDGATDALHVQRDSSSGQVTLRTASDGELEFNTDGGTGYEALRMTSDLVQVYRPIASAPAGSDLITFNSELIKTKSGSIQVFDSGKKLRIAGAAVAGRGLHLGWEGRSVAKIDYTSGDASWALLDPSENATIVHFPDESNGYSGRDARVQIGRHGSGTDKRGRLTMQYDGDNGAPGVLELRADDGSSVFLSFWSEGGGAYTLWATQTDPGTTKPTVGSGGKAVAEF